MVARVLLLCACFALLPVNVWAQTEETGAAAAQPLTRADFDKLNKNLEALTSTIQQMRLSTSAEIAELREEIATLKGEQEAMRTEQKDFGTRLGQISMRSDDGSYHVRFDTNSASGRNELKRAIESTVPSYGEFVVKNKTADHQYIMVNDEEPRHIFPYGEERFRVRPGSVTSRILGQQTYTWHVGVPEFRRVIELVEGRQPKIPQQ
jgi:hypothetical protein